jgi:hypothetical protein
MWRALSCAAARQASRRGGALRRATPASQRCAAMEGFTLPTPKSLADIVKTEASRVLRAGDVPRTHRIAGVGRERARAARASKRAGLRGH